MANQVVLTDVVKRYGDRVILDRVSFEIQPGETVALVGPSGGGKSTILRCINGLNVFEEGQIQVGKHTLLPQSAPEILAQVRRLFGMIFQDFQLFPHMTALQNVMEAPVQVMQQSQSDARHRAMDLLKRVGLEDRAQAYPRQLSGGQKQRVAIARALAMEPRGLLCDEITSALDPELKAEVLNALERLQEDGLTLVMVTHEIHFARRAADRAFVLAEGRIVEQGPPEEVLVRPATERTRRFLAQALE